MWQLSDVADTNVLRSIGAKVCVCARVCVCVCVCVVCLTSLALSRLVNVTSPPSFCPASQNTTDGCNVFVCVAFLRELVSEDPDLAGSVWRDDFSPKTCRQTSARYWLSLDSELPGPGTTRVGTKVTRPPSEGCAVLCRAARLHQGVGQKWIVMSCTLALCCTSTLDVYCLLFHSVHFISKW